MLQRRNRGCYEREAYPLSGTGKSFPREVAFEVMKIHGGQKDNEEMDVTGTRGSRCSCYICV